MSWGVIAAHWYDAGYYAKSPPDNPQGPESGSQRVVRGGSWYNPPAYARASFRLRRAPDDRYVGQGFRLGVFVPHFLNRCSLNGRVSGQ